MTGALARLFSLAAILLLAAAYAMRGWPMGWLVGAAVCADGVSLWVVARRRALAPLHAPHGND